MKTKNRILSWLLTAAIVLGLLPTAAITAIAAELEGTYTLSDAYISVSVSRANGGFTVRTVEGDRLKKSDNNKNLLYHDGAYDTSFVSVRVGTKDYIFGGSYPESNSSDVAVTKSGSEIKAVWSVDDLTFTQSISLENTSSNQSGMISLSISVQNDKNQAVPVQVRVLYDTALGETQDFGYYQYTDSTNQSVKVTQEQVLTNVPNQIYATDDPSSPSVGAYSVSTSTKPTKVAFGHWSHLASTIFDFAPLSTLDFTNTRNEYLTADSAYALYYDLGTVGSGATGSLSTFYGVFSNHDTSASDSVAVNLTAPVRLTLNDAKTDFVRESTAEDVGLAHFSVTVDFSNVAGENAQDLATYALVVRSSGNLRSLKDDGTEATGQDFDESDPFQILYTEVLEVGASRSKTLYFQARTVSEASYERITVGVYKLTTENDEISETNKLGERIAYVLLPGTDNNVPKVSFASMTPSIIYTEGTRHLFVTVTNENMLKSSRANWNLKAYSEDGKVQKLIPHENITIQDGVMDVALTDNIVLSEGGWYLQLEWTDAAVSSGLVEKGQQLQTAPVLHFTVSADKKYKNDSYSVLAVVETIEEGNRYVHEIRTYKDEATFEAYRSEHTHMYGEKVGQEEVLLFFKGEFTKKADDSYVAVSTKTMQAVTGEYEVDNPIVINGCMDFEGGTMRVYKDSAGAICTEFDGELYTNTERTAIWSGEALLTPIEAGVDYTLTPYNENGERKWYSTDGRLSEDWSQTDSSPMDRSNMSRGTAITLVWPSTVGAIGQTISGMIFKLAYAQMGIMYDTENQTNNIDQDIGYVLSFTAMLDLSFATGKVDESKADPPTVWSELQATLAMNSDSFYKHVYKAGKNQTALFPSDINEDGGKDNHKGITTSVMVQDVLFGCGEGFVGVNFEVGVSIQNYVSALPEIEGTIAVNTVNNWSYGIEGKIDLEAFAVEATVKFASSNGIPIPDELYVFVSGFEPGLNIDGCGVIWITGGGGGISNIYDSIFMTQAVPPLKLVLSVSFDLLKVLSCKKATVSLGLTGISLQAEEITVKKVDALKAIDKMGLSFEWYPGIDLRANISVNLFQGIISGSGYIVLLSPDYKDVFFEMFARAQLKVPQSIPVVGGMMIAGADLGINTEKIWGAIDVLAITLGITYYWGEGSVDFGSGSKTSPTFPSLLGYDDIPVYYDEETDRTLYARVGTNTSLMASTLDDTGGVELMGTASLECAKADAVKKDKYTFNLGTYTEGNKAAIVQITYPAASLTEAILAAKQYIKVTDADDENVTYPLTYYTQELDEDGKLKSSNIDEANAHVSYDAATGKATCAFTVTEKNAYDKKWTLNTPASSDVLLYNVAAVPKLTLVKTTDTSVNSGSEIALAWEGSDLGELDQISFYLCKSNDAASTDPGYALGVLDESTTIAAGKAALTVPANVPSGDYYIRAAYSKEDEVYDVVFNSKTVHVKNTSTPSGVSISSAKPAGNLQYELTIQNGTNTDGYLVTVYDESGNATDFENVSYEAEEGNSTVIKVGGSYQSTETDTNGDYVTLGLTAGKRYTIGVTPYKKVTSGSGTAAVYGDEVKIEAAKLPRMVTPTVTFTANKAAQDCTETLTVKDAVATEIEYKKKVYTTKALTLTAAVSEAVTGTWKLDDGETNDFTGASVSIQLEKLTEGEHTVTVTGAAVEDGDSFAATYTFTVDTLPPQLLIASPVNGDLVGTHKDNNGNTVVDGELSIEGITDEGATLTVKCDGNTIYNQKLTETELNPSTGAFSVTVPIPNFNSASEHTLTITATDDVGNTAAHTVTVSHGGLADLQSLAVSVGDLTYEGNVPVPATGLADAKLTLVGVTYDGTPFNLTGYNVSWELTTVEGTASLTDDRLTAAAGSQGMITGKLAVATSRSAAGGASSAYRTASLCFGAPVDHTVSVATTIGGSVTGGGTYSGGATVTLRAIPDSGYRFVRWKIAGASVDNNTLATITFSMPDTGNVTAEAVFQAVTPVGIIRDDSVFIDIDNHWAEESIVYCAGIGLVNGVGDQRFDPDSSMTRAMFATLLYRLAGEPAVSGKNSFTDVADDTWYSDAVLWGQTTGLIKGYDSEHFGTNDLITREQMCTLLTRYLNWAGKDLPATTAEKTFDDAEDVSAYAEESIIYCQTRGLVNGMPGNVFKPGNHATRAEGCTIFQRIIQALEILDA